MKAEELTEFSTLRDLKADPNFKFKLITENLYVADIKIAKQLILKKIIISMAEIIRMAIVHYIFFEKLVLVNDSNQGSGSSRIKVNRKTVVPFHISDELIDLIKQKYGISHGVFLNSPMYKVSVNSVAPVIRQMLHAFITRFKMKSEVWE